MKFDSAEFVRDSIDRPASFSEAVKIMSMAQMNVRSMIALSVEQGMVYSDPRLEKHINLLQSIDSQQLVDANWIDVLPTHSEVPLDPLTDIEIIQLNALRQLIHSEGPAVALTKDRMKEVRMRLRELLQKERLTLKTRASLSSTLLHAIVRARLDQTLSEKYLLTNHMNNVSNHSSEVDLRFASALQKAAREALGILSAMVLAKP